MNLSLMIHVHSSLTHMLRKVVINGALSLSLCFTGQEFFAVEVAANSLVSSSELCMRLIRQAARALYNDSYPNGMAHLCRLPTQIPMKWWPRETLRAGEVIHILGRLVTFYVDVCTCQCPNHPNVWQ